MDESNLFDTLDECHDDDEFYSKLTAKASRITGRTLPEQCSRDIYNRICGVCGRDFRCYMEQGRNVALNVDFCSAKLRDYEAATKSPTEVLPSYSKLSIHCPSGVLFFVSSMRELTV